LDKRCFTSEINPNVRFFVFDRVPDKYRMVEVNGPTPTDRPPAETTETALVDRLFRSTYGRLPSEDEKKLALGAIDDSAHPGKPCASGVADLLWSLAMSPEFQLIQ
jgi:hypothetical protein